MMNLTSAHPERLRIVAEPSGTTDLNVLLAGLLASMSAPVSLRCDPLPAALGAEEEWWMLLQWLLSPLHSKDAATCYVHIQCSEDQSARDRRFLLRVRCSIPGPATAHNFDNPQLARVADRLQVRLQVPDPADAHCLFILQFAGK
ncbi:MAG: hypothetical protein EOO15_15700 [Chitinophagaceae bacterium]|nr:MAG: hypothetical protein EOO15_15700 [Chitinophagaceae bacterium]